MKKISKAALILVAAVLSPACSQSPNLVKLKSEDDKTFYAMGFMLGNNLLRLKLNDSELASLHKGISASAKGEKSEVDMGEYQNKIQDLAKSRLDASSTKEKEAGLSFLDKFVKEGATKTQSGLAYKVLKEGTGAIPSETDVVEVHYHGTLVSGEVFDSSVERKKTVSFPLNRVIPGWTEGLQTMKEGGKTKFAIPSHLAYGEAGAPPKIPGGATLLFEVELMKVSRSSVPEVVPSKVDQKKKAKK